MDDPGRRRWQRIDISWPQILVGLVFMVIGVILAAPTLLILLRHRTAEARIIEVYQRPVAADERRVELMLAFQYRFRDERLGDAVSIGNRCCDRLGNPVPHRVVARSEAPALIDRILAGEREGKAFYDPAVPCASGRFILDEEGSPALLHGGFAYQLGIIMVVVPPTVWLLVMLARLLSADQGRGAGRAGRRS